MFITLRQEGRGTLEYLPVENKQFLIVFYAEDVQKKRFFRLIILYKVPKFLFIPFSEDITFGFTTVNYNMTWLCLQ